MASRIQDCKSYPFRGQCLVDHGRVCGEECAVLTRSLRTLSSSITLEPLLSALVGLLLIVAPGCKVSPRVNEAEAAVQTFHQRLNSEQYSTIYLNTDETFRRTTSEVEFNQLLSAIHRKLGDTQVGDVQGWTVSPTIAAIVYRTKFAGGTATERFRWRIGDGKAWLVYYKIDSNALVIK